MTNDNVISKLRKSKVSAASMANELNMHVNAIYNTARSGRGSRRVRIYISAVLSTPPSSLWPENAPDTKILDDAVYNCQKSRASFINLGELMTE